MRASGRGLCLGSRHRVTHTPTPCTAPQARAVGTNCWMVGPEECARLAPIINMEDVLGGLWSPDDGQINPVDSTMVMAAG